MPYPAFGANNYGTLFGGIMGGSDGMIGSCIEIAPQNLVTENLTITCWIKRDGADSHWKGLVVQRPEPDNLGTGMSLEGGGIYIMWDKLQMYWQ